MLIEKIIGLQLYFLQGIFTSANLLFIDIISELSLLNFASCQSQPHFSEESRSQFSGTFHYENSLNGTKSSQKFFLASLDTLYWRASVMLLLKTIFTSNSLCRLGIS